MLDGKGMKGDVNKKYLVNICTNIFISKYPKKLITITVLISATGHLVRASIYNHLLSLATP